MCVDRSCSVGARSRRVASTTPSRPITPSPRRIPARVGRLLQAERMVQGTATIPPIPPSGAATIQLSATVVTTAGVVRPVGQVTGPFRQLLALEKQVVFDLAGQLGIALTEAERQQI